MTAADRKDRIAQARREAAELVVLEAFDFARELKGHDYGNGQRGAELMRRRARLGSFDGTATLDLSGLTVVGVRDEERGYGSTRVTPTDVELAAAARRLLAPRLRRLEREDYREHTPATRRTREALEATLERFAPTYAEPVELGEAPNELSDEERREATRIRRELERRGVPRLIGGTNELDAELDNLAGLVAVKRNDELRDADRIGREYARTGSYITGEAAASCRRRAEGLEHVIAYAGRLRDAGDVRVAALVLRGALGDKIAARAAKAYKRDVDLERAEREAAAVDLSDGGRLFDDDAPAPAEGSHR